MLLNIIIFLVVILVLYLLVIMPKLRKHPGLKSLLGWHYAHRGLHNNQGEAPENSLRAFALAVQHHYGIELDVQITKDQVPVIHHDYSLKRACGVDQKISELTYEELGHYRLFQSEETIPTLNEALDLIHGQVPLIIELKIPWGASATCEAVSKHLEHYQGEYCVESFNPFGLAWYRKNRPMVIRGQLSTDFRKEKIEGNKVQYFILKHLLFNFHTKPDFIAYQHTYKSGLSYRVCRKLYRVTSAAWTIRSEQELIDNSSDFDLMIFEHFQPKQHS